VSCKKSIPTIKDYWPDGPLDGAIVDLDTTVGEEHTEAVPVFGDISECFAKWRFASDAGAMMCEPCSHVRNQWRGPILPPGKPSF
jgi:hypothetical protein